MNSTPSSLNLLRSFIISFFSFNIVLNISSKTVLFFSRADKIFHTHTDKGLHSAQTIVLSLLITFCNVKYTNVTTAFV
jgi:hypothetical protein